MSQSYSHSSAETLLNSDLILFTVRSNTVVYYLADLEFSRLESWPQDVSRPVFTSLGLGLGLGTSVLVLVLEPSSLGLGLGTCNHEDSVFVTHEA